MTHSPSSENRLSSGGALEQSSLPAQIAGDSETSEFQLWKVLFDQTPEAVAVLSVDDRVVRINKEFTHIFGYEPDEVLDRPINDLIVPPEFVDSSQAFTRLLQEGGRVEVETVRRRKDGTRVDVSLLAVPVRTPSGKQLVNYAIYRDISERKRSEDQLRETEARFRAMADQAPVMIWTTGIDGLCNYFSKPWLDFTGRTMEHEVGLGWLEGVHPDDVQLCFDGFLPAFQDKRPFRMEYRLKRADGEYRWVIESGVPRYAGGEFAGYIGSNIDITDRKQAEEAARQSEKELRDVIETIPAVAWKALPDGSNAFVNSRWTQYTGMSAEQTAGSGWHNAIHPQDVLRHEAKWRECVATGAPFEIEVGMRRADGQYRWHLLHGLPLRDEHGKILKWYGISTDIEDRKQAESCLAAEKRILEHVAKGDPLPEILTSLCRMVEEQAVGVLASILLLEDHRLRHGAGPNLPQEYMNLIDGASIGPSAGSCGTAAYRGEQVVVEDIATDPLWVDYRELALSHGLRACWCTPVFSSEHKVIATLALYYREPRQPCTHERDVIEQITHLAGVAIERQLAQDALRRSEGYLAETQRLNHTGSWAYNPVTEKAIYWSDEMFRMSGFDLQQGPPTSEEFLKRVHPDDREIVREAMRNAAREKTEYQVEHRIILPNGTLRHLHAVAHPVLNRANNVAEFVGSMVDVTERKRAEEERERLHQLEADLARINRVSMMGELAASLAHEIKQPISAANINAGTCLEWLARDQPDVGEARQAASRIIQDVKRASEIIARVRSLFKKDEPQREWIDINETIREMIGLIRSEAGRQAIRIQTELADGLPLICADRVQLQQVFMNLALNAIDAITASSAPGTLKIKTQRDVKGEVVISVRDSGIGLPAEQKNKIFDAFFTTKTHGTGMGLSISRSIIESHGGRLWATANVERGATFQFTLPSDAKAA